MASWGRLRPYFATEPFILCYVLVYAMHFTILPQLIVSKICRQYYNASVCNNLRLYKSEETRVYKDATLWNAVTFICVIVPSLIFILPMGSLSDLIPKKKLLLITPLALMLQSTIFLISTKYEQSHLAFLALGASLAGIFGDYQGALALASSFMAEMTTVGPNRTVRMTIIAGLGYVGVGVGAYIAGFLREKYNFESVFIFSLIISILNVAYIIIVLPLTKKLHDIEEDGNFSASTVVVYTSCEANTMKLAMKQTRIGSYALRIENEMNVDNVSQTGDGDVKFGESTKAATPSDYCIKSDNATRTTEKATRRAELATKATGNAMTANEKATSGVEGGTEKATNATRTTDKDKKAENLKGNATAYINVEKVTVTGWATKDEPGTAKQKVTKTFLSSVKFTAKSLRKIGAFVRKYRTSPDGKFIWLLLGVYAFACCAIQGESYIIVLFAKHSPLSLNSVQLGTYLLLLFQVRGIGTIFLVLLAKRLKANDNAITILGFTSFISTYISMALSTTKEQLYYFSLLSIPFALTTSGIRVLIAKRVDTDEAGTILSMCGFIGMCADIVMAVTTNGVFRMTANCFPGLSILCLAIGSVLGLAILLFVVYLERKAGKNGYQNLDHYHIEGQRCAS